MTKPINTEIYKIKEQIKMNNELYAEIMSNICATILLIAFFSALILCFIYKVKTAKIRQEYIKTLNEHDKAVIKDFENQEWIPFKKKKKN